MSDLYNGRVSDPARDETAPMTRSRLGNIIHDMSALTPAAPGGPAEGV